MRFAIIFAVLLSLVSMASGGAYVCRFNNENLSVGFYCRSSLFAYFADILLYWGGLSFCGCLAAGLGRQSLLLEAGVFFRSRRRKVLFPEPGVSFGRDNPLAFPVYLYIRVPNPDWRIEVAFFAVVSLGFLCRLSLYVFCRLCLLP